MANLLGEAQTCECGFHGELSEWDAGFVPWTIVCPECGEQHKELDNG